MTEIRWCPWVKTLPESGPWNEVEFVFIEGKAFVNAEKHEEVVARRVAERDRYIRAFNSLEKAVTKHIENCIDCDDDANLVRAHRTVMRLLSEKVI